MLKKLNVILLIILIWSPLHAEEIDLLGPAAGPAPETQKSDSVVDKTKVGETESDKDGLFSFLNFSFKKEKPAEAKKQDVAPGTKVETPLEKVIREASEGDINAQLNLGYMYLYGVDGVEVDYKKAFDYYTQAAALNDNVAINNLGSLYYSGIGTERNPVKAAEMFARSAGMGNNEAAVNLAFMYITGNGVAKNSGEAMNLFTKAAQSGNPTAKFMLGYAYYKGFVVPQDYKRAFDLMKVASDAGFDDAQVVIASMYMDGQGVPKNYGKAVSLLNQTIAQGNVDAMMMLGTVLAKGEKYAQDYYTAHILFNLASVRGAAEASERRDFLEKFLKIDEILQAQASADKFVEKPTDLTKYINQTFGPDIKSYIDTAQAAPKNAAAVSSK